MSAKADAAAIALKTGLDPAYIASLQHAYRVIRVRIGVGPDGNLSLTCELCEAPLTGPDANGWIARTCECQWEPK